MKQYPEIVAEMFAVLNKNKKQSMERANLIMGSNKKVKDSEAFEHACGLIVWPQKKYNCSFCKREFRSAQALGGHMNVHRRDRARLRTFSPPLPEYPNPNPSFSSSSSSLSFPAAYYKPSLINSLPSPSSSAFKPFTNEEKKRLLECPRENALTLTPSGGLRKKKKNMRVAVCEIHEVLKKKEDQFAISLDLEMGLKGTNEAVDLELRLGYH